MKRTVVVKRLSIMLAFSCLWLTQAQGVNPKVPAFPGAEGYGAQARGGRGGRVIAVTNLNGSGPGSFRAACDAEGPRIVVFKVACTIAANVEIAHPAK